METKNFNSRLMKMSWEIQRSKHSSRSKALTAAWAILSNEDVTVFYLAKKMSHGRAVNAKQLNQLSLFNSVNL